MKRTLLALALLLAAASWAGAATWTVVRNADCTGYQAATGLSATAVVPCCMGSNTGFCDRRESMGTLTVRFPSFVAGAGATYTAGGDSLTTSNFQRLGMTSIVWSSCEQIVRTTSTTSGGQSPVLTLPVNALCTGAAAPYGCCTGAGAGTCGATSPPVIQVFTTGITPTPITNGGEMVTTASALANASFECMIMGYGG
jgi:hypothetical protein